MAVKKPALPKSFNALKPKSASQKVRDLVWQWWKYEFDHKLTALTSEQFYQAYMDGQMRQIKSKFPETRRVYEQ